MGVSSAGLPAVALPSSRGWLVELCATRVALWKRDRR